MNFIPINPVRTESGALAMLVSELSEHAARPVELGANDDPFSNFRIVSDSLSTSIAGKLGIGAIFKGAANGSDQGFYFDAMTFTDKYREQSLPDQSISATRWGVGIRVLLRVYDVRGDASLNFGLVGAAVELQQARAQYEIMGFGIGIDGLIAVLEEIPAIGDFKYDTYQKLNGTVVKKLAAYIKEHQALLKPEPVAVALIQPLDPLLNARSVYFAMRCIADRRPLTDALSKAGVTYDRETVRKLYLQVAGKLNDSERPSREAEQQAERWLSF